MKFRQIFRDVEQSSEAQALDNLCRELDKNDITEKLDLDGGDDLLASQNLLIDNSMEDEMGLLDDVFDADAHLLSKNSLDNQLLDMLDDPMTLNDIDSGSLSTPNNKEERKNLFTYEPKQNNYLTPDTSPPGGIDVTQNQKIGRNYLELQGNLSVISEEKSMWLQDSVSAASSKAKRFIMSANLSSAFNSARKLCSAMSNS